MTDRITAEQARDMISLRRKLHDGKSLSREESWKLTDTVIAQAAEIEAERAARQAAESRVKVLEAALTDHNDLLRSAMQIAKREGVEGHPGSTNWDAYYNRVAVVLKRHHATANEARAALTHKEPKP